MSDKTIVSEHLKAALLATSADRPHLAHLIRMALIESESIPENLPVNNQASVMDDYIDPFGSTAEFLSRPLQYRSRNRSSFL